jgi:hypothetical protein
LEATIVYIWEEALLNNLMAIFPVLDLSVEEDGWKWMLCDDGMFTVDSTYF